jgi:hypothetical protein
MGSWYDNMKGMRRPNYIKIKPRSDGKLDVTFQYNNSKPITKTIVIDEEVSVHIENRDVIVEKGERWGDWGGAIKCGNVISIRFPETKLKTKLKPVRVQFT